MCTIREKIEDMWYSVKYNYKSIRNYFWCLWHRTHQLPSGLKAGQWHDKFEMIPETLFYALDDYVSKEGEDAFGLIYWENDDHHINARKKMIKILHWYHIERGEKEAEYDTLLNELYSDSANKIVFGETGLIFPKRTEEEKIKMDRMRKLEKEIYRKNIYYSKMVCSLIGFLWT